MPSCQICKSPTVSPFGYTNAKILVIRDIPDVSEYPNYKKPRFSKVTGMSIFRQELSSFGVDSVRFRFASLLLHKSNKNEVCFQLGLDSCLREAKNKDAVLLMGAESVKLFTGYSISDVNGLQVKSTMLSAPIIYACVKPESVFGTGVGELRFCLENFTKKLISEDVL